jgi:hypothetical protein
MRKCDRKLYFLFNLQRALKFYCTLAETFPNDNFVMHGKRTKMLKMSMSKVFPGLPIGAIGFIRCA